MATDAYAGCGKLRAHPCPLAESNSGGEHALKEAKNKDHLAFRPYAIREYRATPLTCGTGVRVLLIE